MLFLESKCFYCRFFLLGKCYFTLSRNEPLKQPKLRKDIDIHNKHKNYDTCSRGRESCKLLHSPLNNGKSRKKEHLIIVTHYIGKGLRGPLARKGPPSLGNKKLRNKGRTRPFCGRNELLSAAPLMPKVRRLKR